jgi:hypothetical protein
MISNRLTRWLADRLYEPCTAVIWQREPDHVIQRLGGEVYLERWWIIPRNAWFNIYLHRYLHDDDDRALHDHPWWSVSLCLDGLLREEYLDRRVVRRVRDIGVGAVVLRSAMFAHRLMLPERERGRTALTLFVTGPRIRRWGFLCPNLPGGWRFWEEFAAEDASGHSRGCGEV